jgi:predicted lipid-binding transport protein (Tim44 family)
MEVMGFLFGDFLFDLTPGCEAGAFLLCVGIVTMRQMRQMESAAPRAQQIIGVEEKCVKSNQHSKLAANDCSSTKPNYDKEKDFQCLIL